MTLKTHIINAVATALFLGAGTTLVGLKVDDAAQNTRIERLENLDANVRDLNSSINRVDKHLSLIDGRLQQQDLDHAR